MGSTYISYRDDGDHRGVHYEVFVEGIDGGPFKVASIEVSGRAKKTSGAGPFLSLDEAMAEAHHLARALIEG